MNPDNIDQYRPEYDENQGVMTKLTESQKAGGGVAQADYMNPVTNQGPEPVKEEVSDQTTDSNGVNDDMLAEEDVEAGNVDVEYEDGDN